MSGALQHDRAQQEDSRIQPEERREGKRKTRQEPARPDHAGGSPKHQRRRRMLLPVGGYS